MPKARVSTDQKEIIREKILQVIYAYEMTRLTTFLNT